MNKALFSTKSNEWQTPEDVFLPLMGEFKFTIDAAATEKNAMLPRYWTIKDDAITQDWTGERVWCNPPYGKYQKPFVIKAAERKAKVAVLLLPARPDTAIWHDYIFPNAEVRFVRGRIRFIGGKHAAPFPSAIAIFRRDKPTFLISQWDGGTF